MRQNMNRKNNEQLSSKCQENNRSSLPRQEANGQEMDGTKKKRKNSRKTSFLRRIDAWKKGNTSHERKADRDHNDLVRPSSSAQNGELFPVVAAPRDNKDKDKNMKNEPHSSETTEHSQTQSGESNQLKELSIPITKDKEIKRQKRRLRKSGHDQHKQIYFSTGTANKTETYPTGETREKHGARSANYTPNGNRCRGSAISESVRRCSPMLLYLSSPHVITSRSGSATQTVYFNRAFPQVRIQPQTGEINYPSHTNRQRFQVPAKFLKNIEQAKKDSKTSVAVYRVHYERRRIKIFHSNPLMKQRMDQ